MPANKQTRKSLLRTAAFIAAAVASASGLSALCLCLLYPSLPSVLGPPTLFSYALLTLFLSLGVGLFLSLRLQRRYVAPLRELIRRANAFSGREEQATAEDEEADLLGTLFASFEEMQTSAQLKIQRADRNRKELERLFDIVPCYITVQDRSFHIIRSNRLFQKDFGEDYRKHCYTIYKNRDTICPNCSVAKTFEDGEVHSNEEEVITRDGEKVSLIVYSAPLTDEEGNVVAVMEMSTNISEVKRLQNELVTQRKQVEQLFNIVPCYISVHDRNFNILQTNEMFKRDFGDREGQKCHRVYKGSDKVCHDCPVQKTFRDGQVHSSEEVVIKKDGMQANVIVYTAPIRDEAGNIRAVMEMSTNITEVKQLQSELEAQRQRVEQLFNMVPCYISIHDRNFNILRTNEMFKRDFGDRAGQKCHRVYKGSDEICHDCPVQKTFRDGQVHSSEEVVVTKDGEEANVIVYTAPIRDETGAMYAVMEMSTNITEVKRLQAELESQRQKFEQLFNMVPCYISIQDRDFTILQTNELFRREFGDREGQKCHLSYKGAEKICEDCPVQKTFRDGEVHSSEEVVVTKDGQEANVIVYAAPIRNESGTIEAVMEMSTNITEVKKLQRELTLMGQTVASMAHTIKNLLMGLEGGIFVVSTALEQKDDDLLMEGWEMVHRNVDKVSRMVKDLLYCAKEREHTFKPVDPAAIAREVYELFEEKAKTDEIELRLELADEIPTAELDPDAVHNLLSNLISNAIDACKFDFSKQEHSIHLRALLQHPDRVVYEVEDNGKGIPSEWSTKVFDNFFSTKGDKGTGIGLLVARKVVQQHHGDISFTSEPNEGTTFRVVLPIRQPELPPDGSGNDKLLH
jgi:PAS domain S-box-containing protein